MIYPLLNGTTGRKHGELGHVNLSQSSMPHPSSIPGLQGDISHGAAVLHGDGHPRDFKPTPGPLGREHPPGTSWFTELLEKKAQDLLLCLAFAVLFFVYWADVAAASGWLMETTARLQAQPCPAPGPRG